MKLAAQRELQREGFHRHGSWLSVFRDRLGRGSAGNERRGSGGEGVEEREDREAAMVRGRKFNFMTKKFQLYGPANL